MSLLGFDTSTAATAACVLLDDGRYEEESPRPARLGEPPGHSRELMPAVARVLERAGVELEEVEAVAVGVGPGTFTGLRIGIATARSLAHAHSLPLRAVSSLEALAAGIEGTLRLPLIDARRGEVFAALYEEDRKLWEPFAATPAALVKRLHEADLAPLAAGDGSVRFRDLLEAAGVEVAPGESPAHVVRGLHLCRVASSLPDQAPETVLPQYLRLPDAQPSK